MSKTLGLHSFIPQINSVTKLTSGRTAKNAGSVRLRPSARIAANSSAATATPARRTRSGQTVTYASAFSIILTVVGLGTYIYMINASVSKGYELKHEQAIMNELTETQKRLVVQQAALGSMVKVNEVATTAGMVPVTSEEFLVANQLSSR